MTIPSLPPCEHGGTHGILTTPWGALHHHRRGWGPSIVLLHDLGTDLGSYAGLAASLEAKRHVVMVDLLGHGGSDLEARDMSPAAQSNAIAELIADLQMERPVCLVGHGYGGGVAIEVAARSPELVHHVVLLGSGSFPEGLPWPWSCASLAACWTLLGAVLRRRKPSWGRRQDRGRRSTERLSWAAWHALGRACRQLTATEAILEVEDLLERSVKVPVLFLWGSDDQVHPPTAARARALELGRPGFIEISGGSRRVHEEQPAVVAELIEEFLAR